MVSELGYSRKALSQLADEKQISRVERGIYVMASDYVDNYFVIQQRLPQGVFSHETALYLLGFMKRAPEKIQMTFLKGFNSSRAKKVKVQPIIVTTDLAFGVTNVERSGGTTVKVYEIERTLLDLLKPKYKTDKELLVEALKQYIHSEAGNIAKLKDYADLLNMESKIQPYLEALL
ncbi:hypothetical protein I588_03201 [Enterococcus pallens ATCC BAA-351]|uniref:Abortive infection protein AbiGI n=2 Tax=Enterococcus pallens TaxID=160454 RepID=R2PXV2_9ENTE|nr:hypothetical protein UAU_04853 [Enterococcus pallens ATCC BAA-351]EOU18212.1 hypothetical protein I588_03201 [Enterococcus pallens ATCC BAA-351]